ncbi:MAG: thioredoxin [Verrucomicrobiales bacterium]|jgi:thioredoxin 1|nr:thioredoxin [Verrucomicrobiales bacterium]
MASENVITLDAGNFSAKVLQATGTVLVDFWAEWCFPCKMLAPLLDQIADANVGKVTIGKVNIEHDGCREIAAQYNISSIPTLLIFQDGKLKDLIRTPTSRANLEQKLGLT